MLKLKSPSNIIIFLTRLIKTKKIINVETKTQIIVTHYNTRKLKNFMPIHIT